MFGLLILASALLHFAAERRGPRLLVYVFKPLTILLILLAALTATRPTSVTYQLLICAGLVFSLAGDVFLMLPSDRFVPGLVSFLVAHLCYIAAFLSGVTLIPSPWRMLPFLLYGVAVYSALSPHLKGLKYPVVAYMLAILLMAWLACERRVSAGGRSASLAFAGALLFVASDTALAVARFRGRFAASRALVLGTYYAGQWLIVRSVEAG